jgi:hypothetical protein
MYYNYGKNYFLSFDELKIEFTTSSQILDFLRGYIELNCKLTLPTNVTNYIQNINHIYDKYPLLIIYFRKKTDSDNNVLNKILNLLSNDLKIDYTVEIKNKIYNKIKYNLSIKLENYNVLNLLSQIYHSNIDKNEIDEYLYSLYLNLSNYRYINYDTENDSMQFYIPKCSIKLIHPAAIKPNKKNISNIGYGIHIIKTHKIISDNIIVYDTGLLIKPQFGYYCNILANNSLSINGYSLGTHYIDTDDTNSSLLITLIKNDQELPDLKLPYCCAILTLKELTHFDIVDK